MLRKIAGLTNAGTLTAFVASATCLLILRPPPPPSRPAPVVRCPAALLFAPLGAAGCGYRFVSLPGETLFRFLA